MRALRCIACAAVVVWGGVGGGVADGFSLPLGRSPQSSSSRLSSNNFYDDFEGFGEPGSNDGSTNFSSLQSRMGQVKEAEAFYDAKLARNWRRGNWGVRGFALDKSSSTDTPALVSVVAAPSSSSSGADISLPQDRALPEDRVVCVGRTDGSVFVIRLGMDYLTTFVEAPKLVAEPQNGSEDEDTMSFRVEREWMSNDELQMRMQDEQSMAQPDEETKGEPSPFEIVYQFVASDQEEIQHLVFLDDEGSNLGGIICTANGISSDINVWKIPAPENGSLQPTVLSGVHSGAIISLKTMTLHNDSGAEQNALFSASQDGTFAFWNLDRNGELIFSSQCTDVANDNSVSLTSADVSNPSSSDDSYNDSGEESSDVIFLGTSNGYVYAYVVQELLASTSDPVPNLRYRAHGPDCGQGEAVTAIKAGGDGTIPTSARLLGGDEGQARGIFGRPGMSSSILLTGGEDGSVKQWEILSQKSGASPSIRMEHWPRMSTQRMKRRAHVFTPGHDGPVTAIAQQGNDGSKFLTCGRDGSVGVWSASSGEELYRMEGFSEGLSSLACLGRELLVTDGMEGFVCVHDFGIPEDAASEGYDLEW